MDNQQLTTEQHPALEQANVSGSLELLQLLLNREQKLYDGDKFENYESRYNVGCIHTVIKLIKELSANDR